MTRVSLKLKGELGLRTLAIFSGNGSKWEPVGVIHWFFSVLAPAVLRAPVQGAGQHPLEKQGGGDCI